MKQLFVAFAIFLCASSIFSCGGSAADSKSEKSAEQVSGVEIYSENCVICHGIDGKAQMAGATDLSKSILTHEIAVGVVTNGRNTMRAFSSELSKEEIEAVVKHVETLR